MFKWHLPVCINMLSKLIIQLNSAYGKNKGKKQGERQENIGVPGVEESLGTGLTMAYAPQPPTDVQFGLHILKTQSYKGGRQNKKGN